MKLSLLLRRSTLARALPVAVLVVAACSHLDPVATYQIDASQLYFALTMDNPAVNLSTVAPYDTFRLTATPQNALGAPMTGLPAPTFELWAARDSTKVTVTPDGLVQARAATGGVRVVVTLTVDGITHTDEAEIEVTTGTPPQIASFSIDPLPPDSAKVPMSVRSVTNGGPVNNAFKGFPYRFGVGQIPRARVVDMDGNLVDGLMVQYTSLSPTIWDINGASASTPFNPTLLVGTRYGLSPGHTRLVARTVAYGVSLADTTDVTMTWPLLQWVEAAPTVAGPKQFVPSDIRLAPYGVVGWRTFYADTVDVTFDDPTHVTDPSQDGYPLADICSFLQSNEDGECGAGNAVLSAPYPQQNYWYQFRQFPVPGVYTYHSVRTGATGRVVVTNDLDPNALP